MAATKNSPEVFEQKLDPTGSIVLDRPFTLAEAAAQDAANHEALEVTARGELPRRTAEEADPVAAQGSDGNSG